MNWKNWPYWLRGGVIGGGVATASAIFTNFCEKVISIPGYTGLGFECLPFSIPWIPFWFVPGLTSLSTTSYEFIVVAVWIGVGALVGILVKHASSSK